LFDFTDLQILKRNPKAKCFKKERVYLKKSEREIEREEEVVR